MSNIIPVLEPRERRRIVATAALLGSSQDGERLAASRGLDRLLAPHGVNIAQVVEAGLSSPAAASLRSRMEPVTPLRPHQLTARMCLAYPHLLSDWEAGFVASVAGLRVLSDKQRDRLNSIAIKVERGRR